MKINYLRPFSEGEITSEAKITYNGRRIGVGDVEVKTAQDSLIAKGLATYMTMKKET
jgi:uncharacterized protein (TIGR00369 family)